MSKMSQQDWATVSLVATVGSAVVDWHGYTNSRGWTDAHRFFFTLTVIAAVGPQLQGGLR
jgi:hypothetical protein